MFHPNCDCTLARVDETVDKKEIGNQADAETPDDLSDLDALADYREKGGLPPPVDSEGEKDMTDEAAKSYRARLKNGQR